MDEKNIENKEEKGTKKIKTMSLGRALAFATSNVGMMLGFVFLGYMVGQNWGTVGKGVGVIIGALLATFSMLSDLMILMLNIKKKDSNKDNKKEGKR